MPPLLLWNCCDLVIFKYISRARPMTQAPPHLILSLHASAIPHTASLSSAMSAVHSSLARATAAPAPPAAAGRRSLVAAAVPHHPGRTGCRRRLRLPAARAAASAAAADADDELQTTREACLKVAMDASKAGAAVMVAKLGADVVKTKANSRDLLTEVDDEVQVMISDAVRAAFPDHGFIGEESIAPGAAASSAALAELLATGPDWLWAGAYIRCNSAQLELTLPLSAQRKLTLSPINSN